MEGATVNILAVIVGVILIFLVIQDSFESIVLPRRVSRRFRLSRMFYASTWMLWSSIGRKMHSGNRREFYLSYYGPLSLILMLIVWVLVLVLSFALIQWGLSSALNAPEKDVTFGTYLYMSGTTFVTLGLGDVTPMSGLARFLVFAEAGFGFGLLALIIGYIPVIYQSFSRREINISLLDARAGSPSSATELLRRHRAEDTFDDLNRLLSEWERWSAELLESHLSYPVLCYFRSQHDNQSWLRALTTVLDTCALVMVGIDGAPIWQARMTFAMARHAVVDIAQVFRTAPSAPELCGGRLTTDELSRLRGILA